MGASTTLCAAMGAVILFLSLIGGVPESAAAWDALDALKAAPKVVIVDQISPHARSLYHTRSLYVITMFHSCGFGKTVYTYFICCCGAAAR